ncbi:hypothetical protein D5045_03985 [Verminephrobacter eiseniae]|nr:hypothetical protein [Verminephrobacter eiseniae]
MICRMACQARSLKTGAISKSTIVWRTIAQARRRCGQGANSQQRWSGMRWSTTTSSSTPFSQHTSPGIFHMPTFLTRHAGLTQQQALLSNSVALSVLVITTPYFGWLSERMGRKPLLLACCIGFARRSYPVFRIIVNGPWLPAIMAAQIIMNLFIARRA